MEVSIDKPITAKAKLNSRLNLADPTKAWLVKRGKLDLFYTWQEGDDKSRLHPLARIEAGGIVLGMDLSVIQGRLGIVGMTVVGSEVVGLDGPMSTWFEGEQATLAKALEQWVETLVLPTTKVPKVHHKQSEEGSIEFKDSAFIVARHEPRWLKVVSAEVDAGEDITSRITFFPLTQANGVRTKAAGTAEIYTTESLLIADQIAEPLAQFHGQLAEILVARHCREQANELEIFHKKEAFNQQVLSSAMTGFANVLGNSKQTEQHERMAGDPLFASLQRVAEAQGIQLAEEARGKYVGTSDALGSILRTANIRSREVILTQEWYKHDNGPLLSWLEEGNEPVALLPVSPRRYQLVKANGETFVVDEAVSETLIDHARMLYRPLPEKALNAIDLIKYAARGTLPDLLIVLAMAAAGSFMGMVVPLATGLIYDQVIPKADVFELGFIVIALLTATLAGALFQATKALALVRFEGRVDASLQAALWDRILSLPVPFFKEYSSGDLNERALGIQDIRNRLSGQIILSLISSVFSVSYFFLLLYYSPQMALVALALGALTLVPLGLTMVKVQLERKLHTVEGQLSGLLLQLLVGISKLRMSGAEERAFARWAEPFAKLKVLNYKANLIEVLVQAWNAAFSIVSLIAIFSFYMYLNAAEDTTLTVGQFIAFNAAFTLFLLGTMGFSDVLVKMLSLVPIYERTKPILEAEPEASEVLDQPGELSGSIEVSHLSFRYPGSDTLVLNDVSFKLDSGQFVAIVGPSGSGKSTLLRMLLGFEQPQSGAVYYDDRELAGLDIRAIRRQIGVVLQNSQLVPGSLFDNIVGSLPLTLEQAWDAAAMVGLDKDVQEMPMGMYTVISDTGGSLSGGQIQRLLIARALVNKPRILFFDEATSALDNQTQAVVTASLNKLSVTRVVIAHRLSTVIGADKILVIDAGKVAESGTYDELMEQGGIFYRLANRQLV